jgi:hypothetical protein
MLSGKITIAALYTGCAGAAPYEAAAKTMNAVYSLSMRAYITRKDQEQVF